MNHLVLFPRPSDEVPLLCCLLQTKLICHWMAGLTGSGCNTLTGTCQSSQICLKGSWCQAWPACLAASRQAASRCSPAFPCPFHHILDPPATFRCLFPLFVPWDPASFARSFCSCYSCGDNTDLSLFIARLSQLDIHFAISVCLLQFHHPMRAMLICNRVWFKRHL